jgi:DNA ligase 1
LENNTTKYPEIMKKIENLINEKETKSFILDCEIVAMNKKDLTILPFQTLMTRGRKNISIDSIKIEVCLFIFDILYLNGKSLLKETFFKRREILKKTFQTLDGDLMFANSIDSNDIEEIQEFLNLSIKSKCEGLFHI